ncbi:cation diffusion facilitator family transporter [bacterium]|nr:cation diffusion facilitator family transporter [bacterium]
MEASVQKRVKRVTVWGACINVLLAILKAVGGVLFHSQALIADAIDSTGDLITDVIAIVAVRVARRPVDRNHPYGHGRVESLASLIIAGFLLLAAFTIGRSAVITLMHGTIEQVGWPAALIALLSIGTKESLFRWTRDNARKAHSRVLEANAWHHRSDAFSSIAVLIGVTSALLIPGAWFMDAVASLVVTLFILRTAVRIGLEAAHDLVDTEQDPELLGAVEVIALGVPQVVNAHRIRSRRYGPLVYVDLDIEVDGEMSVADGHDVAHDVKERILEKYSYVADAMIHVEPVDSHLDGEGTVRGM